MMSFLLLHYLSSFLVDLSFAYYFLLVIEKKEQTELISTLGYRLIQKKYWASQ